MKLPPRKYIYRKDTDNTRARWLVEFRTRKKGSDMRLYPSRIFSDSIFGGREKALIAARAWRDDAFRKIIKRLGWKRLQMRLHTITPNRSKTRRWPSPEYGVSLFYTRSRPPFWRASCPNGKRCFGVLGWGYKAAYRGAMEYRRKMIGMAINIPPIPPPPPIPLDVQAYLDGVTLEQLRRAKRIRKKGRKKK